MISSDQMFLQGSGDLEEINNLLKNVEESLRIWQPYWSPFMSAPMQEEIIKITSNLSDIRLISYGGFSGAERKILLFESVNSSYLQTIKDFPIYGIRIEGNFLFDRPNQKDIRQTIIEMGILAKDIGDIWICNDRGAEAICTRDAAEKLNGLNHFLRQVFISFEAIEISELRLPIQRNEKRFSTVEASKRLDAIASAGFGLSRAKISKKIKEGNLRLNWQISNQSSRDLKVGDQIQLEERGSVEVISIQLTKRQRWRVELLRK